MRRKLAFVTWGLAWVVSSASGFALPPGPGRPPIYLSSDCEANGEIPALFSMLSFASVAFDENKNIIGEFSANLELLPGAGESPRTMAWWNLPENIEAYRRSRVNPQDPEQVMKRYLAWIESLPGEPVFMAYPAPFDFMFVYWYMMRFAGRAPFQHRALDVRSYLMGFFGSSFREANKANMPKAWFSPFPHTHDALDDARAQGILAMNMLEARRQCDIILADPPPGGNF